MKIHGSPKKEYESKETIREFEALDVEIKDSKQTEPVSKSHIEVNTSEIIYEKWRIRNLQSDYASIVLVIISIFLAISANCLVGFLTTNTYIAINNLRYDAANKTFNLCNERFNTMDPILVPISVLIIIIFILVYKRRIFLRKKYKFKYIGLPMIVSQYSKVDRWETVLVYGLVALNVFNVFKYSVGTNKISTFVKTLGDPTGLLFLLFKVVEVILLGIRYYPILVALRTRNFLLNFFASLYMLVDFGWGIFLQGECEGFITTGKNDGREETGRRYGFFLAQQFLNSVPQMLISALILISVLYRMSFAFIDLVFLRKYGEIEKTTWYWRLLDVKDDHEMFFSPHDLQYVRDLINKENNDSKSFKVLSVHEYSIIEQEKPTSKVISIFRRISGWKKNFRYSSKVMNTFVVSIISLYYVMVMITYNATYYSTLFSRLLPDNFTLDDLEINVGEISCEVLPDFCIEALKSYTYKLPVPDKVVRLYPELRSSINAIFIVPCFLAFIICTIQILFLFKDIKIHLLELYKSKCEFVKDIRKLNNNSIVSKSFHFGGYVTGYLLQGFLVQYLFMVLIGLVIFFMRVFLGDEVWGQIALKLIPVLLVLIVKIVFFKIMTKVFLNSESKILAIDNFRAYNVFVYFIFFFDIFMGFFSGILRIIKGTLLSVFMLPRISYGFMGRQFEDFDAGYGTYSSFLHMEAMHTNPIIVTFCSILYYKDLDEHIFRHKLERQVLLKELVVQNTGQSKENSAEVRTRIKMKNFGRRFISLEEVFGQKSDSTKKLIFSNRVYNRKILARWHLWIQLSLNKDLIKLRGHNVKKSVEKPQEPGLLDKIKLKFHQIRNKKIKS